MMTALAARYEVITHDISSMLAEKLPCMCGRATLVMLVSSTCITVTVITEKVMAHFRAELIGASVGGAGGGGPRAGTRSSPDASCPSLRTLDDVQSARPVDQVHQAAVVVADVVAAHSIGAGRDRRHERGHLARRVRIG